jgi:hypothetical protein
LISSSKEEFGLDTGAILLVKFWMRGNFVLEIVIDAGAVGYQFKLSKCVGGGNLSVALLMNRYETHQHAPETARAVS